VSWYSELGRSERRTFWACFGGFALDGLDVQIYSLVMPALISAWTLSSSDAGFLATAALLSSSLGGWGAGLLADRYGRVRVLKATILWFAAFTFLAGFANNYPQLLWCRALQGLGFGGEWSAGSVLIGEVVRAKYRGRAVGTMQSAFAIGWGLAVVLATLAFRFLPGDWAWRALFFAGILPAIVLWFARRLVEDPPVFRAAQAAPAALASPGTMAGITGIFRGGLLRTTLLGALLAVGAQGGYYAITTWLPTFLRNERHLTVLSTGGYLAVIISGAFSGYLTSAVLSDRLGRRPNFQLFAVGSLAIVTLYTQPWVTDSWMLVLGFPLGFFSSGIFSGMGAFYTELFPTAVRGSGQGFCYNAGRGVAALFPTLVGIMGTTIPLRAAIGIFAAAAYGLLIIAALLLPETRGRELQAAGVPECSPHGTQKS
jgi:MFS family permease